MISHVENENILCNLSLDVNHIRHQNDEINQQIVSSIPEGSQFNIDHSSEVVIGTINHFNGSVYILPRRGSGNNLENHKTKDGSEDLNNSNHQFSEKPHISNLTKKHFIIAFVVASSVIIAVSITLALYFRNSIEDVTNGVRKKHQMISRSQWGGRPPLFVRPLPHPTTYVIISHTGSPSCDNIKDCSRWVRQFQDQHLAEFNSPDVGYNFLIGGDENIYIARGWDAINFHINDTIGISFIGNFIHDRFTPGMIEAAQILLEEGLTQKKLSKEYKLIAHNQTGNTLSPGTNVYSSIKFWPHYSSELLWIE